MKSFHNTIKETGVSLQHLEANAQNQEQIILGIFKDYNEPLSASQVLNLFPKANTPITSIRRAISNLKNRNILMITKQKIKGMYKVSEHLYQLYNSETLIN